MPLPSSLYLKHWKKGASLCTLFCCTLMHISPFCCIIIKKKIKLNSSNFFKLFLKRCFFTCRHGNHKLHCKLQEGRKYFDANFCLWLSHKDSCLAVGYSVAISWIHGLYFVSLENVEMIYKQKIGTFCGEVLKCYFSLLLWLSYA